MTIRSAKIAISLPAETLEKVEELRRELGLARSEAILEAVRLWLRYKEEEELEQRYVRGYRRKPEAPSEVEPLFRAGLSSFNREDW